MYCIISVYPYHVEVHTSEEEMNAATNSQVFITLYGMLGDSGRRLLSKSRNNKTKFQTGQVCYVVTLNLFKKL